MRHVPFDPQRGANDTHVCNGRISPGNSKLRSKLCGNKVVLGMQMYVGWHTYLKQLMAATGGYRYTIEDLSGSNGDAARLKVTDKIFSLINKPAPTSKKVKSVGATMQAAANKRAHRGTLSWNELFRADKELALQAWELGKEFGYSYPGFDPKAWNPSPKQAPPTCMLNGHQRR